MSELLFFGICFLALALMLCFRIFIGPTVADRANAADCVDALTDMALILFALYTGRGIFLDIALVAAVLGFVGTTIIGRYLEGKL
ncbi:MAG: cation:proton antiporter [Clostridiales bacterium]|nr:cation:proton antiporter [Candidatus Cacconaster stercorequi]